MQIICIDLDINKSIEINLKNMKIQATHLMHEDPDKFDNTQNIAFLLHIGDQRLLHVGDAMPDIAQLEASGLINAGVTCLIVPFRYLITEKGIEAIAGLYPRYLVAAHFPMKEYDKARIFEKANQIKNSPNSPFPKLTYFLTESMAQVTLR